MDPKLRDVMTSVMAAVGSVLLYMGWTDATTWAQVTGGLMALVAVAIPFMMKKA